MSKTVEAPSPARARTRAQVAAREREKADQRRSLYIRSGILGVIVIVVSIAAIGLAWTRLVGPAGSDPNALQMVASMEGFAPKTITASAGTKVSIDLIDRDTSMHSDGGGVHAFNIDVLGVHQKVQPLSDLVFSFTAPTTPGTYDFYCDVCCGGKDNPDMHGTLTVTA